MGQRIADWFLDDTLKTLEVRVVKADGSDFDLTGCTATLVGRRDGVDAKRVIDRAGTITTPAGASVPCLVTVADVPNNVRTGPGLSGPRDVYTCFLRIVKASDIGYVDVGEIGIAEAP